MYFDQINVIL